MRRRAATLTTWILAPLLAGAAGCTSVVPGALRGEVDRDLTYPRLARDPERHRGRLVLVAGQVVRLEFAGPDLEVTLAERPLSPVDESPVLASGSRGDVVVRVPGGARAGFREGQAMTVVGVVLGRAAADDPESPPRLEARNLTLWPAGGAEPRPMQPDW